MIPLLSRLQSPSPTPSMLLCAVFITRSTPIDQDPTAIRWTCCRAHRRPVIWPPSLSWTCRGCWARHGCQAGQDLQEWERVRERDRDFRWMRGLPRWRGRLRPIAVSSKICERDYSVDRTEKVNLYQQIEEYKQQLWITQSEERIADVWLNTRSWGLTNRDELRPFNDILI